MECTNGHATPTGSAFCPTCGAPVGPAASAQLPDAPQSTTPVPTTYPSAPVASPPAPIPGSYPAAPVPGQPVVPVGVMPVGVVPVGVVPGAAASPTRGMYTAAAIINWVVMGLIMLATGGIGVIVAAWFIPMTIRMHKNAKGPYKHTSLGVCTLLFCNFISGILLLVDDSGRPTKPRV